MNGKIKKSEKGRFMSKKAIPAIKTILISRIGLTKVDPGSDFAVSNLVEAAKIILSTGG